jgi:hypothetical protein
MTRIGLVFVALLVLMSACVTENRPESCDAKSVTIELTLTTTALTPNDPAVCRDQEVTLEVASEVDGILHIHGYDTEVPASAVKAGETLTLSFTAGRSGQFPIELHPDANPEGVALGIFTVHEP